MTKDQRRLNLEREVDQLDREATDMGHDLHPWSTDETHVTHTACKLCGGTVVVRMTNSITFKSGLPYQCKGKKS